MKTAEHIIETVDKLVRKYHTRDPYELCQLLGIKIHYYDLQKKLKGFFFTDKQFENRLNDNLEELVQVKKRLNRQPLFYLVGNQGQGKPVCEEDD